MKLKDFIKMNGLTYKAFGESIGATKAQIANYVRDKNVTLMAALKIQKATYGKVAPLDLVSDQVKREKGLI